MDVQKQYDRIVHLKENLKWSPTLISFLESYKEDLLGTLRDSFIWTTKYTKKSLLELLDTEQSKLSLQLQSGYRQKWLHDEKILPTKSVLERKKKEEMAKVNYLPMILQLAASHPQYYFRKNFDSKVQHKELIDYVVIDPNMVPQWFLDTFQIESVSIDGSNIKELFKRATPLEYHKEKSAKTWRVIFIDGKLVVFRELQQLLHKKGKLTQGEKRRVDYKKYFNAYDDIYSAIRSQIYVVDKAHNKLDDYRELQINMIELIQEIKFDTKHFDEKRKLDDIINEIKNATSFPIMASKFYNLFAINFTNKWIAAKHLEWASNKVSKELYKLSSIILEIQLQADVLQQLLATQEQMFLAFSFLASTAIDGHDNKGLSHSIQNYYKQLSQTKQKTAPFTLFEQQLKDVIWQDFSKYTPEKMLLKTEVLLALQKTYLQLYQLEHKIKLWIATENDFLFDMSISDKYPSLYKDFFENIDTCLIYIQELWTNKMSLEDKETCLALLEKLKKLPDWEDNIETLKAF